MTNEAIDKISTNADVFTWIWVAIINICTVKNNRNFTDTVIGNCDKKSTGNREFTGNCPYILYINSQFTVLLRIFCKFTGK